ncbi:efflux RND transporter periplasmic adaptor subunit [Desemzia sp. RIT804]|uniref:efflux RND transporter periplasmic adaptor subunit n=1 Tax=Desemzia sp. RIT 804 TaxID=2810209 RepID=UPI00194EA16D|nr:efflux RND transporter periplasmic adaptor subunit [Desemzia sp. RIT 804]MBM6615805.1 efflux RND transporter periplasmic adaptor subunit [Desemzia sp. RIT 804]
MKVKDKKSSNRSFLKRVGERKGFLSVGIIVVLILVFFIAQHFQSSSVQSEVEEIHSVHIVREEDPILFEGIVKASEVQEEYYDPSKGVIAEILVEDGQEVEEETELFTYTNEENQQLLNEQNRQYSRLKERRSEAETALANAKDALTTANANIKKSNQNVQALAETEEENIGMDAEFEVAQTNLMEYESDKAEAEAAIESAEMSIRDLNDQMEDIEYEIGNLRSGVTTTVIADFSGIVELNNADEASLESSEQPIIRLLSKDVKVEATVSEYDYNKIKEESPVQISLVTSDKQVNGTINQISSLPIQAGVEGSSSSRYLFTVIPEEPIQYGFSVQVGFSEGVIYLPQSAVIEEDGTKIIFVNADGIVERREVEVHEESNFYVLDAGLEIDEEVLLAPHSELADGDEVMVMYD